MLIRLSADGRAARAAEALGRVAALCSLLLAHLADLRRRRFAAELDLLARAALSMRGRGRPVCRHAGILCAQRPPPSSRCSTWADGANAAASNRAPAASPAAS